MGENERKLRRFQRGQSPRLAKSPIHHDPKIKRDMDLKLPDLKNIRVYTKKDGKPNSKNKKSFSINKLGSIDEN